MREADPSYINRSPALSNKEHDASDVCGSQTFNLPLMAQVRSAATTAP
jgi:hypothetical protein